MQALVLLMLSLVQGSLGYRVVCVYTNWSQYRPDGAKFLPEDVDSTLCTHLIYVYAKLKANKLEPTEWNDEGSTWSEGMYDRINNLKQVNPELKTLLGVGGWMMGSKDFSKLAAGRVSRKIFARTSAKFLRDRAFDGLAIDWQHPTKRGGKPRDKVNFTLLLKEIRNAFDAESKKSGLPPLLLTTGVSASREIIDDAYEIDNITRYTDFMNVMAYDLHGAWDNYTGHPSQLYPRDGEFGHSTEVNVDAAMRYWMSKVPDRTKLVLGVSTYGRTFTLRKARHNDYNVPTTGPGVAGEYTQQPGMLAYYERCSQYADAARVWNAASQVAYWYSGNQWIAGEDTESIRAKVNWIRYNNIGGIAISSLDMDDYAGMYCTGDVFPLLNAIREQLMAPLPKQHSLRTTDRQTGQVVAIGTAQPHSLKTTTRVTTSVTTITYPPTHDTFQFIYGSTTTGAPTTFPATAATKRIELQPVLDISFADRSHYVDGTANNSNMQTQITHSKPLNSKAIVIQPTHRHKQPSGKSQQSIISTIQDEQTRFSDKTSRYPSLSRQPSQPIINRVQTEATRPPKQSTVTVTSSDDKDLRNFLKHAADLPTHSLINGIMKLLGKNGHSSSGAMNKIAPHTSSTRTTRKQTSSKTGHATTSITEAPIRMHLDAPISRIPDLRLPSRNQIRGLNKSIRPFLHQKLQVSRDVKVSEPLVDRNKHVVSSNLKHVLNGQFNWIDQQRQTNANKIKQTSKSAQPKRLLPPPFPLPSQKEAQPSKSFLDMKDLGFLIN